MSESEGSGNTPMERGLTVHKPTKPGGAEIDLFRYRAIRSMFANRAPLLALQIGAALVFGAIVIFGFLGPRHGEDNFAVVVTWMLWWLVLPLSFVVFARAWCAVCPLGAASDVVQKVLRFKRRAPGSLLRKGGIWIAGLSFLGFAWAGTLWHFDDNPSATAITLLALLSASVATALVYQRRAWCRYMCPVGLIAGFYSMLSIIGLRPNRQTCRDDCNSDECNGAGDDTKACPLFEVPRALDGNRDCNLCGACVRRCPHESMRLRLRNPFAELWQRRRLVSGEGFFVMALMAVVFLEVVRMTPLYPAAMKRLMVGREVADYDFILTLGLLAMIATAAILYWSTSRLSGIVTTPSSSTGPARYGYAYIPIVLAGYLGATIQHLAVFGVRAAKVALNQLAVSATVFDLPAVARGVHYEVDPPLKVIQLALLALGVAGAIYVSLRIARQNSGGRILATALPHMILISVFSLSLLYLYLQPMGLLH